MKVFHHNDLDGRCAAAIIYHEFSEVECIEISYNHRFPIEIIEKDETIYIVDYSISPDEMCGLWQTTTDVIWIDHHKTAIKNYKDFVSPIAGIRRTDHSGAWLTWEFIHPDTDPPEVVQLVDDWDMWTHEDNPQGEATRHFVAGMKTQSTAPNSGCWRALLREGSLAPLRLAIIREGAAILEYESRQSAEYFKAFSHTVHFEGHTCRACNRGMMNSTMFQKAGGILRVYQIHIAYVHDGKQWIVTLYSPLKRDKASMIDVSEIAKKYGGGGHTHAAGFVCEELPWMTDEDEK